MGFFISITDENSYNITFQRFLHNGREDASPLDLDRLGVYGRHSDLLRGLNRGCTTNTTPIITNAIRSFSYT